MAVWIADVILKLRQNNLRQKELAEKMGVSECYISRILRGKEYSEKTKIRIIAAVDELIAAKL